MLRRLLLVGLLPLGLRAQDDDPKARVDALLKEWNTRWYAFARQERKIGFGQFVTREKDGLVEFEDAYRGVLGGPERLMRVTMRCTRDDRLTPRFVKVESRELSYELELKDGRGSATIAGKKRDLELPADTVTLHSVARLVCVLPRRAGFERRVKFLDLETLELSDAKIFCEGEQNVPGKVRYVAVRYRLTTPEPVELWVDQGILLAAEMEHVGGAIHQATAAVASEGYDPQVLVCQTNLATLVRRQHEFAAKFGGADRQFPAATGRKFWLALAETDPPLVGKDDLWQFICPRTQTRPAAGLCSYRGPKTDVNSLGPNAIVGCDDPMNHPDGIHLVTLGGEVRWAKRDSEEYNRVLKLLID
jgi:hypothetical protein